MLSTDAVRTLRQMAGWWRGARGTMDAPGRGGVRSVPYEFRRFELKDALTPGGTATAYRVEWDGSFYVPSDTEFEVVDNLGSFRGRGKDVYSTPHNDGSMGIAINVHDRPEWEIVAMQPHALTIRGLATAAVAGGATSFSIDNLTVLSPSGGIVVTSDPAGSVTVYGHNGLRLDDNTSVIAVWNEETDQWYVIPGSGSSGGGAATMVRGTASSAVTSSTASFGVASPVVVQPSGATVGSVTAYNVFGFAIDSGGEVLAVWNENTDHWECIQAECPA